MAIWSDPDLGANLTCKIRTAPPLTSRAVIPPNGTFHVADVERRLADNDAALSAATAELEADIARATDGVRAGRYRAFAAGLLPSE